MVIMKEQTGNLNREMESIKNQIKIVELKSIT